MICYPKKYSSFMILKRLVLCLRPCSSKDQWISWRILLRGKQNAGNWCFQAYPSYAIVTSKQIYYYLHSLQLLTIYNIINLSHRITSEYQIPPRSLSLTKYKRNPAAYPPTPLPLSASIPPPNNPSSPPSSPYSPSPTRSQEVYSLQAKTQSYTPE